MAERAEIYRFIREQTDRAGGSTPGGDEPLRDLGFDSVAVISLAAELSRRWDLVVPDEVVLDPEVTAARLVAAVCGPEPAGAGRLDVIGAGAVVPTGRGLPALWDGLLAERATRLDIPYDGNRGHRMGAVPGATADEVTSPDRLLDLVRVAAEEALVHRSPADRRRITLVVGTTDTGGNALGSALAGEAGNDDRAALAGWISERAAETLGLGEAITIGSASASGAVALGYARDLLLSGDVGEVLVVGADTVSKTAFYGLAAMRTLGKEGCRPFHENRGGIGLSEGAAACLLRRPGGEGDAPVLGRMAGYGASSWTTHMAAPESAGIEEAIRRALASAGTAPDAVSFVNAHGPGTKLGDIAEIEAFTEVFGAGLSGLPINSVKGVLWHLQGGAGVIESLVCLQSLSRGRLTPTTGAEPVDQRWAGIDIVTKPRDLPEATTALSVSCGLGGVNTAIVWERA